MKIDDRKLKELIVESEDLQADALRDVKSTLPDLAEIREDRRGKPVDLDRIRSFNDGRRRLLRNGGMGLGALSARGLLGGAFGATLMGIVASPAHAQAEVDVQILQTAASLENLAVATYKAALGIPGFDAVPTVAAFAMKTMEQHGEHADAFNAQATTLGGKEQTAANPDGNKLVEAAMPNLAKNGKANYPAIVELATMLEQIATQTYVMNVTTLDDNTAKQLMASIMGVEAQHLATLRAVGALVAADATDLITVPPAGPAVDVSKLPAAAGSVAFPEPFEGTDNAFPPESGAVK